MIKRLKEKLRELGRKKKAPKPSAEDIANARENIRFIAKRLQTEQDPIERTNLLIKMHNLNALLEQFGGKK